MTEHSRESLVLFLLVVFLIKFCIFSNDESFMLIFIFSSVQSARRFCKNQFVDLELKFSEQSNGYFESEFM